MSGIDRIAARTRVVAALLVACATLVALLAVGCSGGTTSGGTSDEKAMREVIAKFYAAQGNLDLAGMKASIYDPQNIAGLATATVPPDAKKTEVTWKNVGDTVVISVPSQELTITVTSAKTPANAVTMTGPGGQSDILIMKKDGGVWKIDVAETEKARVARASQQSTPATQSAP